MFRRPSLYHESFELGGASQLESFLEFKHSTPEPLVESSDVYTAIYDRGYGHHLSEVTFGHTNAFEVYQDACTPKGTTSLSNISWLGSTQLFLLLVMCLPRGCAPRQGVLSGNSSSRVTPLCLFVCPFPPTFHLEKLIHSGAPRSMFMVSIADRSKYYQFYLSQGLGMGIGAGLIYVSSIPVQGHHWRARRALAMGLVVCGSSTGGIIFPIMLNRLFNVSAGFEWGVRASAFFVLTLSLLSNILINPNAPSSEARPPKAKLKVILTDAPYLLANASTLVINWGLFFPYFYLQLYATLHGVDADLAIMNAASMFGRILPNMLADRFGPFNVVVPVTAACGPFGVIGASTVVFVILFGFFSGAYLSLCAPCLASLVRDPSETGARFGITYTVTSFGALTGSSIAGALLGNTNPVVDVLRGIASPWWEPILFSALALAVSLVILTIARNMIAARKYRY
ncbi:MFS general substrate transporter [Fomitopsis betulina]|nr:MFS general substrate transporter [Fomitopsis betulina]